MFMLSVLLLGSAFAGGPPPSPNMACASDPGAPPDSCWCNHQMNTRCNKHKTKTACLTNYNHKAGGPDLTMLDQICGWSVNEDKFGGADSGNCRSKPFIVRKEWVPIADFGACQAAVEEESGQEGPEDTSGNAPPTMPPTCAMCSQHDNFKKECFQANEVIEKYCVDACIWNKKNDTCAEVRCSDFTADGMIKCEKKSAKTFADAQVKKLGAACYFNANTEECQGTIPDVVCTDYNREGLKKGKKACKKLPKFQNRECKYDKMTKMCKDVGAPSVCKHVKKSRTCEKKLAHCNYDPMTKECRDN